MTITLAEAMSAATNPHDLKVMLEQQGIMKTGFAAAEPGLALTPIGARSPRLDARRSSSGDAWSDARSTRQYDARSTSLEASQILGAAGTAPGLRSGSSPRRLPALGISR